MLAQLQQLISHPLSQLTHRQLKHILSLLKAHSHPQNLTLLPFFMSEPIRPLTIKLIVAQIMTQIGVLKETPFKLLVQAAQRGRTVECEKGTVCQSAQGGWVSLQGEMLIEWEKGTEKNQYLSPCAGKNVRKRIRLQKNSILLFLPKDVFKRIYDFRATQLLLRRTSFLRGIVQFDCFSQRALLVGLDRINERVLKFGQFLIKKGQREHINHIYAIQEGQVTLSYGHPLPLLTDSFRRTSQRFSDFCTFGKGQLVGIQAAVAQQRLFSVRCSSERVRVQVIDLGYLRSRLSTPQFLEMLQIFLRQLKFRLEVMLQKVYRSKSREPFEADGDTRNKSLSVKRGSQIITHFISDRSVNQKVSAQFLLREKLKLRDSVSNSQTFKEKRVKDQIVLIKRLEQQSPYSVKKRHNSFLLELLQENKIRERPNKKPYLLHRSIKF